MTEHPRPDTMLVSRSPGETRYALMAGEELIEVVHRRDAEVQPGAIYLGRAGARLAGINALFVDIGDAVPGVLAFKAKLPAQGAAVPVAVVVPPRGGKGAELKFAEAEKFADVKAPGLLRAAPEPIHAWWARDAKTLRRILCAPRAETTRVKALLPAAAPVADHGAGADMFAAYGVDEAIAAALRAEVSLPGGGSLIIESTAAVTAVDVNSGAADPATANAEALGVLAMELRRRNIAGHIVVDMIPERARRRAAWPRLLAEALADDSVPAQVAGLTPLGMIELTRRRLGLSLAEALQERDGVLSAASVAYGLLRDAVRFAISEKAAGVALEAAPEVVALLQGALRAALDEAEATVKGRITLGARAEFARGRRELRRL